MFMPAIRATGLSLLLSLTLLVSRVSADHTHDTIAANDLAVSTHLSD
jgi:hypothetical protein